MKYGSVCSGIEAASVAWEPLGMTPAWFSEFDAFPSAVLAHHWPHVDNLGDMTKLPKRVLLGEIEAPDVLVGGTPCQSFSVAGLREGFADERGQLTIKYVELLDAIDTVRVRAGKPAAIAVWENVPGVLSDKNNAFGCFLGALAGEDRELQPSGKKWTNAGCVYGPERAIAWRVLDAQYFGVAQRRRRVFVVASARADIDPAAILFERESLRRDTAPSRETGQDAAARAGGRTKTASHWSGGPHPSLSQSHNTGGIGASNQGLFSQQGAGLVKGFRMAAFGEYADDETASTMKARDYKDATDLAVSVALRGREGGATAELSGEVATALRAFSGGGDKPHVMTVHGTQDPCFSYSTAFALGRNNNGENAVYAFTTEQTPKFNPECALTLTKQSPTGGGQIQSVMQVDLAVRRLTPTETERLQGFPDNHTRIPWRGKDAADCPDGPRYKSVGNSMAVPVMQWIGSRIQLVTAAQGAAA